MGDFTTWPWGSAVAAASAAVGVGAAAAIGAGAMATGATTAVVGAAIMAVGTLLTMRTLPSASVISSSDTFDSDTRSISVLSFLKSINAPYLREIEGNLHHFAAWLGVWCLPKGLKVVSARPWSGQKYL
jgi:hypothetical protein